MLSGVCRLGILSLSQEGRSIEAGGQGSSHRPIPARGRLQSVQNAAARLITGTRRTEHITLVLAVAPLATGQATDFV